jgi:hypothetical protein
MIRTQSLQTPEVRAQARCGWKGWIPRERGRTEQDVRRCMTGRLEGWRAIDIEQREIFLYRAEKEE